MRGVQCAFYHNFHEKRKLKCPPIKKPEALDRSPSTQSSYKTVYDSTYKSNEIFSKSTIDGSVKPSQALSSFIPAFSMSNFMTIEEKLRMEGKLDSQKSSSTECVVYNMVDSHLATTASTMLDDRTCNSFNEVH